MAKVTNLTLRHKVAYRIHVRNFSAEGTFKAIIPELQRVADMGIDLIMLHPIHPSGRKNRQGEYGRPAAPYDYYAIAEDYGTIEDFQELVHEIHALDMQIILEMDFHHTAMDSPLLEKHPEYYVRNRQGNPKVPPIAQADDIYELNFAEPGLWDYLFDVMRYWAQYVDGLFCKKAALVRQTFWNSARMEVEDVHRYFYWMGESLRIETMREYQRKQVPYNSEGEMYAAFDVLTDSDIANFFDTYISGEQVLKTVAYMLNRQEVSQPQNYVKFRRADRDIKNRIASKITSISDLENFTAFSLFTRGCGIIEASQEYGSTQRIDLSSGEKLTWEVEHDLTDLITSLARVKEREAVKMGYATFVTEDELDTIVGSFHYYDQHLYGVFNLKEANRADNVQILIPDGNYENLIDGEIYQVKGYRMKISNKPVIIAYDGKAPIPKSTEI